MSVFEQALFPNLQLFRGDELFSAFSTFRLDMQASDGNVVLSVLEDQFTDLNNFDRFSAPYRPIWSFGIPGRICRERFIMQDDGNLVAYDFDNAVVHGTVDPSVPTGTNGNPGAFFRCQVDGNL